MKNERTKMKNGPLITNQKFLPSDSVTVHRSVKNGKSNRYEFAWHETRNGVEARRDRSPNPSPARRAASVERSHFGQKLFNLRAVSVNAGDSQPHVARIISRQSGQRRPPVIAK